MPSINEDRTEAWTARAADPAVRAAERAIVTGAGALLADTLTISTRVEARRRLARVLELKDQAEREPGSRAAYQRAADELRNWAAGVYLASLREPPAHTPPPDDPTAAALAGWGVAPMAGNRRRRNPGKRSRNRKESR